jgi:putative sigma-54 modulation protein
MKINIKATNIELTPAITDYVHRKISPIEKYLKKNSPDIVAQVEVGKTTQHHKTGNVFRAEVHIIGDGLDVYAVAEKDDLYAAIDIVKDEIMYNMVQSKGKRQALARRGAEMIKYMIKGLGDHTARGFSWGIERLKFKSFKKRP